jgi:EAL domain-containing protein (putative c-di-GMP-specific phosphodiesterase class I)
VAETLNGALDAAFAVAGQALHVGSSIGVAVAPGHGADSHTLLQCADVAMNAAKRAHRGYAVYDAAQASASAQEVALVGDLRQAIAQGALTLVYQPKVDLQSGQVCGVEALVRWPHPTHGLITPNRFIPLSEQTGLITPLTLWVLEAALAQCQRWRHAGQAVGVAVNLSMETLHDPHLLDAITQRLTAAAVPPQLLTLELTESALMTDTARALDILHSLRSLGVRVAIDDFGTGYSSLAYLKRLPVDDLKIDGSFVRELAEEATDRAIVAAMVGLAHSLGLTVVAEGVEDAATAGALRTLGCDQMQGYYLARPMPAEEVLPWMRERAGPQEYRASA